MNSNLRHSEDILSRVAPIIALLLAVACVWLTINFFINLEYFQHQIASKSPSRLAVVVAVSAIWLGIGWIAGALFLLNRENGRVKRCAVELHQISHLYRDQLGGLQLGLSSESLDNSGDSLAVIEKETLTKVCVKISNIFTNLIGRKCICTVKLLSVQNDKQFCFTWARSEDDVYRLDSPSTRYWVGTGENTALDIALKPDGNGMAYFYCADLLALKDYKNQREDWSRAYRSAIVVPIQYQTKDVKDILGFLSVDTLSTNRLRPAYHLDFLFSFADQMYSFMSTVRAKYARRSEIAGENPVEKS